MENSEIPASEAPILEEMPQKEEERKIQPPQAENNITDLQKHEKLEVKTTQELQE